MKKNILIIIQTLARGGAEKVAADLSKVLSKNNNVTIVLFKNEVQYEYAGELLCVDTPDYSKAGLTQKCLIVKSRINQIKRIKKDRCADISISFMPDGDLINVLSHGNEVMIGTIHHNPYTETVRNSWHYYLRKIVLHKLQLVITPSNQTREAAIKHYELNKDSVYRIYNTCDVSRLSSTEFDAALGRKYGINANDLCVVTMGSHRYEKAQWHMIRAFKLIHDRYNNAKLILIGDGPYKHELNELSEKLELNNNIVFTGHLNDPYRVLRLGKVFMFSSISESFANVLIEAMAVGVPCVCADCDYGPREILDDGKYGVLIPPFPQGKPDFSINISDNERVMADAVMDLLENPSKRQRLIEVGKQRAKDFDIETLGENWEKILKTFY